MHNAFAATTTTPVQVVLRAVHSTPIAVLQVKQYTTSRLELKQSHDRFGTSTGAMYYLTCNLALGADFPCATSALTTLQHAMLAV